MDKMVGKYYCRARSTDVFVYAQLEEDEITVITVFEQWKLDDDHEWSRRVLLGGVS